jgi:chaperonin cofactor prefoldin
MDLQEQTSVYVRDLKGVQSRLQSAERESRSTQMTTNHLATLDHSVNLYRSVGKAFFLTERESLERRLQSDQESLTKTQRDLQDRQLYLERRIQSNTTNLKDLMTEYAM